MGRGECTGTQESSGSPCERPHTDPCYELVLIHMVNKMVCITLILIFLEENWGLEDLSDSKVIDGFPGGASDKEPACQCRRHKRRGFDPWIKKIPWRRAWQSTPVFLPGESHGQRSLVGYSPLSHRVGHGWSDLACTHARSQSWWWRISEFHSNLSGPQPGCLPPYSLCQRLSLTQWAHALWACIGSPVSLTSSHGTLLLFGNTFFSVSQKRKLRLK